MRVPSCAPCAPKHPVPTTRVVHDVADLPCDPRKYTRVIVCVSGGKDSFVCLLYLLEIGVDPKRIEIWHHCIDGREGSGLFDWLDVVSYVRAIGDAFGLPVLLQWKQGGFERELLKRDAKSAGYCWQEHDGEGGLVVRSHGGERAKVGTRFCFPQVCADLRGRWCSALLKIDAADKALIRDPRFREGTTLVITGERAGESAHRARYNVFEPDRADLRNGKRVKRHIDRWRPIHAWTETQVWETLKRWRVNPHPAYRLGWGRLSCSACIFGNPNQWASFRHLYPDRFEAIATLEDRFRKHWSRYCKKCGAAFPAGLKTCRDCGASRFQGTLHRTETLRERADRGEVYEACRGRAALSLARAANKERYTAGGIILPRGQWELPAGAFGESDGPS